MPMTTADDSRRRDAAGPARPTSASTTATSSRCSDVTLEVDGGEVTCVLGDNGAGKSTLIKIIAGLHQHDEGTYEVEGEDGTSARRARRWTPASPPSTRTWRWCR